MFNPNIDSVDLFFAAKSRCTALIGDMVHVFDKNQSEDDNMAEALFTYDKAGYEFRSGSANSRLEIGQTEIDVAFLAWDCE